MMRSILLATAVLAAFAAAPARAQDVLEINEPLVAAASPTPIADSLAVEATKLAATPDADAQDARPTAIEYTEGHETRAKIHKYASWATLPLMGTEWWLGQKLYDDPNSINSGNRGVHGAVGSALIGFFAVQSVTGIWNLIDEKSAPGNTKRLIHGILMLGAEGGFIAAAVSAPGHDRNNLINFDANKATHRNIALVSFGVGTAGYVWGLLMGGH